MPACPLGRVGYNHFSQEEIMHIDLELYRQDVWVGPQDNVRLSVIDVQPERPARTLVFIHGFGGWATQWRKQLQFFSDSNRCIAPDLRGHGLSDKPDSSYSMEELLADLSAVLAALQAPGKLVLLGHSFGGALVTEYALRHAERVEKLVIASTPGEFALNPLFRFGLNLPLPILRLAAPFTRAWLGAPPVHLKPMYLNAMVHWNGWSRFRDLKTPTLVITGHRDRVFSHQAFEQVPQRIAGAQHVDVPVSSHHVMLERADAVNRAIQRFLEQSPATWRSGTSARPAARERPWVKHYDDGVPETVALPHQPLARFLTSAAQRFPFNPAIKFEGHTLQYWYLDREANHLANALVSLGVLKGDRVVLLLPNIPQAVIAFYGTLRAGATVVFANPVSEEAELIRQVNDSRATTLMTLAQFEPLARAVREATPLRRVILTQISDYLPPQMQAIYRLRHPALFHPLEEEMVAWTNALRLVTARPPDVTINENDLAVIQYTGGTTAAPKGVMLTHAALVANSIQTRHWIPGLREGREVFLSVLPFSHIYGLTTAMNVPVLLAATMVLLPTFRIEQVLEAIKRHRPTIFPGVPTMYVAINNVPNVRRYGIQSIRACISGAAPLPVEVQEAFEKLTRGRLVEGYGLTECGPVTHANPLNGLRKVGSIGVPLPNTDAKIVHLATGQDLPAGAVGELAVRGPQMMVGYWGRGDETDRTIKDGWLYTGDVAVMDDDGYFRIISRRQEMILAGQYNVYPRDVEEILYEHPKVKEAAVVGIGAAEPGQKIKAYVVLREGEHATPEELMALCRARLAEWEVPAEIEFRHELPKTFVGKVLRRALTTNGSSPLHATSDE
jgi:long-chain acyl-CoA synthetase